MQPSTISLLWAVACLGTFAAGTVLLVRGLRYRYRGDEPHCANCNYNLTGVAVEVCPECGTQRTAETTIRGEPYRQWRLAMLGIVLMLGAGVPIPFMLKSQPTTRRPASATVYIKEAKTLIADLKIDFRAGVAYRDWPPPDVHGGTGRPDSRVSMLDLLIHKKIPLSIQKCVSDQRLQNAAMTECVAANQLMMLQVWPAWHNAKESKNPKDAQAIVPLMDQLDKHMDNLLQILKGY